jgi:hypothetical protein
MAYVERLFEQEILPGHRFGELPLEHPLYRAIFPIREKAQVPDIHVGMKTPGTRIQHRVLFDRRGRTMVPGFVTGAQDWRILREYYGFRILSPRQFLELLDGQ